MRKEVIQKLEKVGFAKDNLAKNDIFKYSFEITQTEPDEFEITDR